MIAVEVDKVVVFPTELADHLLTLGLSFAFVGWAIVVGGRHSLDARLVDVDGDGLL